MKKLFVFISVTCLYMTSCNNNAKQQEIASQQAAHETEKAKQDSLAKLREAEKQRFAFEDSISIYAWGDVKFGMTKKEVLNTKSFSGANKYDDSFSMAFAKESALKESLGLNYYPTIWVDFGGNTVNEVIRVRIDSSADRKEFEDLREDIKTLINEFKRKYGEPTYYEDKLSSLTYRDIDEMDGSKYRIAQWSIGSGKGENGIKYISLTASRYVDTSYRYDIIIYNTVFPKQPKEKTQKEIEEDNRRAKEAKEAVENSF